jgi:hypothetical protein
MHVEHRRGSCGEGALSPIPLHPSMRVGRARRRRYVRGPAVRWSRPNSDMTAACRAVHLNRDLGRAAAQHRHRRRLYCGLHTACDQALGPLHRRAGRRHRRLRAGARLVPGRLTTCPWLGPDVTLARWPVRRSTLSSLPPCSLLGWSRIEAACPKGRSFRRPGAPPTIVSCIDWTDGSRSPRRILPRSDYLEARDSMQRKSYGLTTHTATWTRSHRGRRPPRWPAARETAWQVCGFALSWAFRRPTLR